MRVANVCTWAPQDEQLRRALAGLTGRHLVRQIAQQLERRLYGRVMVGGRPLSQLKVFVSVDETGSMTLRMAERHTSMTRLLFYTPLMLLRRRRFPFFAISPFKAVADDLASIEQAMVLKQKNPDLP